MKVGFETCKLVYDKLGVENARTALKIYKSLTHQKINPVINKVDKDVVQIEFYQPYPDETGYHPVITQQYNFAKRILNQYTSINYPYVDGKTHPGQHLDIISFDDMHIENLTKK